MRTSLPFYAAALAAFLLGTGAPAVAQQARAAIANEIDRDWVNWSSAITYRQRDHDDCEASERGLRTAIGRHFMSHQGFVRKRDSGQYVWDESASSRNVARMAPRAVIDKVRASLQMLDPRGRSAVLIYDYGVPKGQVHLCSFLITPS